MPGEHTFNIFFHLLQIICIYLALSTAFYTQLHSLDSLIFYATISFS